MKIRATALAVFFITLNGSLLCGAPSVKAVLPFDADDSIEVIRAKIRNNGYDFSVDHNWVYDMPPEMKAEFFGRRRGVSPAAAAAKGDIGPLEAQLGRALPASFDWRNHNGHSYIGPIRDQSMCGSCYAFGACGAAEGTYNLAVGLYDGACADFSESFIMWCLGTYGPYSGHFSGCYGADYDYAELQALTVQGICSESSYPYTIFDPGSCTHWSDPRTVFQSWHRVPCGDIDAIKTAIMTYGVVDAAVDVGSAFEAYSGGLYEDTLTACPGTPCDYTDTNHAISLVGWDDNGGDGYWILRNSWGETWGESGYMRIKYTSARVACEVCYLVHSGTPMPTPTPVPPTPTPSPPFSMHPLQSSVTAGDTLLVSWSFSNLARIIDAYFGVVLPDGSLLVMDQRGRFQSDVVPLAPNFDVTGNPSGVLSVPVPYGLATGTYTIEAVCVPAGANVLNPANHLAGGILTAPVTCRRCM